MNYLFIPYHLSTGGMPQYLLFYIEKLIKETSNKIFVVEFSNYGNEFVVQKDKIRKMVGEDYFYTLYGDDVAKLKTLKNIINKIEPDVIHLQEIPETTLPQIVSDYLYKESRSYELIETSHDSRFDPSKKIFIPNKYIFISEVFKNNYLEFRQLDSVPYEVVEYTVDKKIRPDRFLSLNILGLDPNKKHVLNVGLFTPGKNQGEIMELAKLLLDYPVEFHFVGNTASNFSNYWKPLVDNLPTNCKLWGERSDVDLFYSSMDLLLFTSKWEGNPLVPKEALAWGMPVFMYNLDSYKGSYDDIDGVSLLTNNREENINNLFEVLNLKRDIKNKLAIVAPEDLFDVKWEGGEGNRITFLYKGEAKKKFYISIRDYPSYVTMYGFEMDCSPYHSFWANPFGRNFCDLEKSKVINSIIIEFYEDESYSKILLSKKIVFNKDAKGVAPRRVECHPFDPSFLNAWQFFDIDIHSEVDFKDKVVIDAGANIGLFTLYALSKGAKKVYAIEPQSNPYSYLLKNLGKDSRVVPLNIGLFNKSFKTIMKRVKHISPAASILESVSDDFYANGQVVEEEEVDIMSFKGFISKFVTEKIDILKVDIEGAEYELFEDITEEWLSSIETLILEFHYKKNNEQVEKILNKLNSFNSVMSYGNTDSVSASYKDLLEGRIVARKNVGKELMLVNSDKIFDVYDKINFDQKVVIDFSPDCNSLVRYLSTEQNVKMIKQFSGNVSDFVGCNILRFKSKNHDDLSNMLYTHIDNLAGIEYLIFENVTMENLYNLGMIKNTFNVVEYAVDNTTVIIGRRNNISVSNVPDMLKRFIDGSNITFNKNKPDIAFITYGTKSFFPLIAVLAKSISYFSKYPLIVYGINDKYVGENVISREFKFNPLENLSEGFEKTDKREELMFVTTGIKPAIIHDAICSGVKYGVFVDADAIVRHNIDSIFSYSFLDANHPIVSKNVHDWLVEDGKGDPLDEKGVFHIDRTLEWPLMQFLGVKERSMPIIQTCIFSFNYSCKSFVKEWADLHTNEDILKMRDTLGRFSGDERTLNCLLWKHKKKAHMPVSLLNINSINEIKMFYNSDKVNHHLATRGSFIPNNKEFVKIFHGVKDPKLADEILNYVKENDRRFAIYPATSKDIGNISIDYASQGDAVFSKEKTEETKNVIKKDKLEDCTISSKINGRAIVKIKGNNDEKFLVDFTDLNDNSIQYRTEIGSNLDCWTSREWFTPWGITVRSVRTNKLLYEKKYDDFKDKKVLINLMSYDLGDTLAWFSYIEEFRKKHSCLVYCLTPWNKLLETDYPKINFTNSVPNDGIFAKYNLGIFRPWKNRNPRSPWLVPLAATASDILGLNYDQNLKTNVTSVGKRVIDEKYICIAPHSTAICKYWNNVNGWQDTVDYLNDKGYKVVNISKEMGDSRWGHVMPSNTFDKSGDLDISSRVTDLAHSDMFIGLGSGLSWLANSIGTPSILIAGHSKPFFEYQTNLIRIEGVGDCVGCFNDPKYEYDRSWDWCPGKRDYDCSKLISSDMVIDGVEKMESLRRFDRPVNMSWEEFYGQHHEIMVDKCYEKYFKIEEGDVVVDIGANIGLFSHYTASKGASKTYSIEPELSNFRSLERNKPDSCVAFNCALSNTDGYAKLYIDSCCGGHSLYERNNINNTRTGESIPVSCMSLDTFIKKNNIEKIDFLKIDTEGAEWEILQGLSKENLSKVKKVVMEFHPKVRGNIGTLEDMLGYFGDDFKFHQHVLNQLFSILYFERK